MTSTKSGCLGEQPRRWRASRSMARLSSSCKKFICDQPSLSLYLKIPALFLTGWDRMKPDWTGLDRPKQERMRQDRTGPDWTRQDRTRQDRTRRDRTGQERTGTDRTGYFYNLLILTSFWVVTTDFFPSIFSPMLGVRSAQQNICVL